jgi:hypothetical protein
MLTSKKYMLPLFLFHPFAAGTAVAVYVGHWHYNPGKNAPILDSKDQLGAALTSADRRVLQNRLEELVQTAAAGAYADGRHWTSFRADAAPALDHFGGPTLQARVGAEIMSVGITRSNILSSLIGSQFAAALMEARLREELKSAAAKKTARADVESDLALLKQLLESQLKESASTGTLTSESAALPSSASQ